ncbi:hypothetical protein [Mycolicibacter hiberniae]|uniref:Uncharacterized protein n=1 Tax=Mycolicibacter hiberniae TaxID=29314 RepID=A0A7I7XAP6_9MYCO|nr:hypothetical protein [Mycolicibacter hiberniae]MCV7087366.1 hypothetical protein [Mycolicibacter hiberniae]BBZ25418.1 hypothetical protein MHIB_38360 [Mycolicibacter hiberniae]
MSLAQLESQIADLRAQAASIQKRSARASDSLATDASLSDVGRQAKRDAERDRTRDQLRDLRKKETELIDAMKQKLEKRLFGLSSVTSSDPGQVLLYRDSQDRAARLTQSDEAAKAFAAALRSDDKILAAAVLGRALDAGWTSIVNEYVKHNPSAGEDLNDFAQLRRYQSFEATIAYAWGA